MTSASQQGCVVPCLAHMRRVTTAACWKAEIEGDGHYVFALLEPSRGA